jgi:hypothetical protein
MFIMSLFKKVKDILFDEEEVIETEHKETKQPVKEVVREPSYTEYKPPIVNRNSEVHVAPPVEEPVKSTPKVENAFPFPDFDEDEFDHSRPVVVPEKPKQKVTNVMDFERKKRLEKKNEFSRLEKVEPVEKKKFKPSPIISPVYGILNEDYVADDIRNRGEEVTRKELDVESVRKKAFGSLDEVNKSKVEEKEIVRSFEPQETREQKVRTIDELLEDTSDVKINLDEDDEIVDETRDLSTIRKPDVQEAKDEVIDTKEETKNPDSLEDDLFDLIDSMYDNREDGE